MICSSDMPKTGRLSVFLTPAASYHESRHLRNRMTPAFPGSF
jgi:hypothetical protein